MAAIVQDEIAPLRDPLPTAVHLRGPERAGLAERFAPTDPLPGAELTAHPRVARVVRSRKFQFLLILPNQIIFWTVIFVGLLGTAVPGLNFGAAITWYVWFCLVFVMMVVVGRAWCAMCPSAASPSGYSAGASSSGRKRRSAWDARSPSRWPVSGS
jgi:hypothetical protein